MAKGNQRFWNGIVDRGLRHTGDPGNLKSTIDNSPSRTMLRIGSIQLDVPFVQAALSGYSDLAMRRLARRYGAPYTLNEVVLDRLVLQKGKRQKKILRVAEDDHPVGGQLLGADPEDFASAAVAMTRHEVDPVLPVAPVWCDGECRHGTPFVCVSRYIVTHRDMPLRQACDADDRRRSGGTSRGGPAVRIRLDRRDVREPGRGARALDTRPCPDDPVRRSAERANPGEERQRGHQPDRV